MRGVEGWERTPRIHRGKVASTFNTLLEGFVSGRDQRQGSGASQLKGEWCCAHTSICGCFLLAGNEKYEKILQEAKEKMEKDSQRDEAVVLGEAAAAEPPTDDSGTVVRTAAVPFGMCHPPAVSLGPLAPHSRLPGALLHLGPPCPHLTMTMHQFSVAPGGCPPPVVVPPVDAPAS